MRALDWCRVAVVSAAIAVLGGACGGRLEVADCGPERHFCSASNLCCPNGYACGTGANGCPVGGCCAGATTHLVDGGENDAGDEDAPFGFGSLPTPGGVQGSGSSSGGSGPSPGHH